MLLNPMPGEEVDDYYPRRALHPSVASEAHRLYAAIKTEPDPAAVERFRFDIGRLPLVHHGNRFVYPDRDYGFSHALGNDPQLRGDKYIDSIAAASSIPWTQKSSLAYHATLQHDRGH